MSLLLNYLNAAAYTANLLVTYAIGAGGVFGTPTNGELSAKYQTIVTPAGWAFSIWGIIFVSELIWTLYQLTPAYRDSPLVREGVRWYFIGVCAAQIAWTLLFSFEFISLSLIAMLSILYCLVRIVTAQYKLAAGITSSSRDYWILKFPFSIHAAWIVAASLVNMNLVLVKFQVNANVQYIAALMSLGVLLLTTAYFLHLTHPDFVVPLVSAWALFAIGQELKNPKDLIINTFATQNIAVVRTGSIVAAILILAATIARGYLIAKRQSAEVDSPAQVSDPLLYRK